MATVNEKASRIAKSGKAAIEIWTSKPVILNQQSFVSNPNIPSWLTLSRLSAATRFDSTGALVDVAADTARFDYAYNGSSWIGQGLLLEKQSTNQTRYSASLDNFTTFNATRATADIFSNIQGYSVTSSTSSATSRVSLSGTVGAWQSVFALSGIVKKGTSNKAMIVGAQGAVTHYATADLNTKVISPNFSADVSAYVKGSAKDLSGDRFRIMAVFNAANEGQSTSTIVGFGSGSAVNGDTAIGYGLQIEQSEYPSSFIKTTASAATRSQDNLQLNTSNYTGSIKLTYKRQDTEILESSWIDLTSVTNPILTNSVAVGIWLQNIAVYNRILTAQEKASA